MIQEILSRYIPDRENLLRILHDIQEIDPRNHVSHDDLQKVATWLKIPVSSVYGVLRYYSMYSTQPRGKHIIRVCNSVVCYMKGAERLKESIESIAEAMGTAGDVRNLFTVEVTECLGHCEFSPVMMADDRVIGPLSEDALPGILDDIAKSEENER